MIRPISTEHNGHLFRSRLEARWAVFFKSLNIDYEYEPEGYELSDGSRYLPDFYLPACKIWLEVKAKQRITEREITKALKFAEGISQDVLIVYGNPYPKEYTLVLFCPYDPQFGNVPTSPVVIGLGLNGARTILWGIGLESGRLYIAPYINGEGWKYVRLDDPDGTYTGEPPSEIVDIGQIPNGPMITALTAARQARFEFGSHS